MGNGPAPFSEIGKKTRDLLLKDYNFNHKFTLTSSRGAGLGLTANGVKVGQSFIGDIITKYQSGKTTVDVKVDTESNVSTTIAVDQFFSGAKAAISFKIPDQKSAKLDILYLHDHAAVNSSIGLTHAPLLELTSTIGTKEISLGGEVGFDSASASFTKYNAGIGFNNQDLSAALILGDKGETLRASYIHVLSEGGGAVVGAEMVHRFNTYENSFTIGGSCAVDPLTTVKTRFESTGKVAVLCHHEWRPKSLVTVSAEYDPKAVNSPTRLGLSLALKP